MPKELLILNKYFQFVSSRGFSTERLKKSFVTTPIFYVNARPHIGHLYSAVIADTIHRYNQLKGCSKNNSIFSTGTDEHGIKIQQAAFKNQIPVEQYCSKISQEYLDLFQQGNINYTHFIRTSQEKHKETVRHFWKELQQNNYIYSTSYSGWYCVSDETFLSESQLNTQTDGTKISIESGHPVEWCEETNYMFSLSKLQSEILRWIKQGNRIKPIKFEKILLDYLAEPLPDVSISRPSSRVFWGIRVPGDESQSIYVWLDALVNYLTCSGYPNEHFRKNWPPTLHVIGKDILKFHGIYWPGFLIAAGLEPPEKLLVHSHWTVDNQKMSKSKLNVVDPAVVGQNYSMEGLRYYLLREGVAHSDGNYTDVKVSRVLNSELADTLGNLISRACAKTLNPHQIFPRLDKQTFVNLSDLDETKRLVQLVAELQDKCTHHYDSYNFYLVVDQVIATLHAANKFFETCKPWELKASRKDDNCEAENRVKLETIISLTMETLRVCGIILQPIIPELTQKLLDKLNIDELNRKWEDAGRFSWNDASDTSSPFQNGSRELRQTDAILFKRIVPIADGNNSITDSTKPKDNKKERVKR